MSCLSDVCVNVSLLPGQTYHLLFVLLYFLLSTVPNLDKGIEFVNKHYTSKSEHPLALYIFSKDKKEQQKIMKAVPSGTAAINDVLKQAGNVYLVSTSRY